jgi:hypothetical protein
MMNISTANVVKPTPRIPRAIGNGVMFAALAAQPMIAEAGDDIMSHGAKFYLSLIIAITAAGIKGFTMMLAENNEPKQEQ